ncbi:MAG: glycosyl hydrolase-related protein [Actinomycetota bacterium]|nr:glycosyl hydrolase-related protein [Actinomycetota bacterium]
MAGFARWLFGLAADQPLEYRHLRRIRHRIYTTVATLEAEVVRSAEPIPFSELDHSAFRPIETGAAFGETLECAWLHIRGEIPDDVDNPVVLLGVRGETLIHLPDGRVVDTTSTVFLQGDLPHSGGKYRPLEHLDTSSGSVDFYADVAYNGFLLYPYGSGIFHGARVATRDEEVLALYYDYLALVVLAGATEDAALESELRVSLAESYARFSADDMAGARESLRGSLAATSDSDFVYSAIGHGHLDMAWLWPLRETHRKAARTYTRALNTIERRDGYLYGTSQPQQMFWMKHEQPEIFERLKAAVAAGRIELQGSFWVEPDTNLTGGESLVRQALVGRRFLQEEFGLSDEQLRLCWLPDTFGYNGNLPQILKKSGMDWFQTIKLAWNKINDFPHRTFHWQGIDGSSVLVHMPPEGDYNSRAAADNLLNGLKKYPERELNTALLVYGSGDGGGGPGESHLELLAREKNLRGLPRVEFSTARAFFEELETLDVPHTHVGELYLETHQGTYTTQGAIKRGNRVIERTLHNAEALAVIVGDDSRARLESHWREVLLNQFHDILPGSSITRVNTEAVETYARIQADVDAYIGELVGRVSTSSTSGVGRVSTSSTGGAAPTAVNLTSFPRRELVKVADSWYRVDVAPYAAATLTPADPSPELGYTDDTLTNGLLTLRFGPSGEIVSCLDTAGAEHSAGGLNRLVLHQDPYQWPFDAWDIKQDYFTTTPRTLRVTRVENSRDGATVTRRQLYAYRAFTIEQRVVLEAGSDVVRFDTVVDWHSTHRMLRADFFPAHYGSTVRCEIQFGHLERVTTENDAVERAQFEVCAHKWVATQDDSGGFALLNDSKYGHRAKDGLLSLNLLRSPTFPDKTADRGIHRFSYAFTPFATDDLAKVVREGYRLNNPLLITEGASFESVASIDEGSGVVIETIKPAESGTGVVVRLYESLGKRTTTALRTTWAGGSAQLTDLLERPLGAADLDHLEFGPFEIVTVLLEDSAMKG